MSNDVLFKTRTMARIQEEQGRWAAAAEIYRHLLEQDPHDESLRSELERVESKLNPSDRVGRPELAELFGQWLELLLVHRQLSHLKHARERLRHDPPDG